MSTTNHHLARSLPAHRAQIRRHRRRVAARRRRQPGARTARQPGHPQLENFWLRGPHRHGQSEIYRSHGLPLLSRYRVDSRAGGLPGLGGAQSPCARPVGIRGQSRRARGGGFRRRLRRNRRRRQSAPSAPRSAVERARLSDLRPQLLRRVECLRQSAAVRFDDPCRDFSPARWR